MGITGFPNELTKIPAHMDSSPRLLSEEELRSLILLPLLRAIGVSPEQIRIEDTITLRLGRTVVTVDGSDRDRLSGRLDLLVLSHDGHPLFLVELKADGVHLTDDDIDQGISYARLQPKMPPIVVVTNGTDTRLFDTISREPILRENIGERWVSLRDAASQPTAHDLHIRLEALKHFLGYSTHNVTAFCRAQQASAMRQLRGQGRKYVPETFLQRGAVRKAVAEFLSSPKTTFVVTGGSGVGKTCEMCALAESLADEHLTLFFNGAELFGSLVERIAEEFNWHFAQHLPLPDIVDRLDEIGQSIGRRVVFVLDAVDEAAVDNAALESASLARKLHEYHGRVKLLLSLKTAEWHRFASLRGNPSWIAETLFPAATSPALEHGPPQPSFELLRFNERERDNALTLYASVYGTLRRIEGDLRDLVRDPLMLRLTSDILAAQPHATLDARHTILFQRYLEDRVARSRDPGLARRAVLAVAKGLSASLTTPERDRGELAISEASLRAIDGDAAGDGVNEAVAFGILSMTTDSSQRRWYSFTYDRVRDFVIAHDVLRLEALSTSEFGGQLSQMFANPIGRDVLRSYMPTASSDHWAAFLEFAESQARQFVDSYSRCASTLGAALRQGIDPYGGDAIGAILSVHPTGEWAFGLFQRGREHPVVIIAEDWFPRWFDSRGDQRLFQYKVSKAQTGRDFAVLEDPNRAGAEHLLKEIREAIRKGRLDELASEVLMIERVFALASTKRVELKLPPQASRIGEAHDLLPYHLAPLNLQTLRTRINERLGEEFYEQEFRSAEIRRQEAEMKRSGNQSSGFMTISYPAELREVWRQQAAEETRRGRTFHPLHEHELTLLLKALDRLGPRWRTLEYHLPSPDAKKPGPGFEGGFSDRGVQQFLQVFFQHAITAYREVTLASFGVIATRLPLNRAKFLALLVEYERPEGTGDADGGSLIYSYVNPVARPGQLADVRLPTPGESVYRQRLRLMATGKDVPKEVETIFGPCEIASTHFTTLRHLVWPARDRALGHSTSAIPRGMLVRDWVYAMIEDDLRALDTNALQTRELTREPGSMYSWLQLLRLVPAPVTRLVEAISKVLRRKPKPPI